MNIEEAIAAIEKAGYTIKYKSHISDDYRYFLCDNSKGRSYVKCRDVLGLEGYQYRWNQERLIQFARKCQMKAFW